MVADSALRASGGRHQAQTQRGRRMRWTAERVDLLRRLWAAGETAAAIGDRLGGMSRSAVLGKVFRLRLDVAHSGKATRKQRRAAAFAPGAGAAPIARRRRSPKRSHQSPSSLNTAARHKKLLELTNNTCRWPHGRPGTEKFHFCGVPEANLERGVPYCARHMRRAYPMFADALTDRRPALERHLERAR
jgi:GcrA cell cycle regulator